jgi:alkanesulfonate monooxygenase SsuD/methylene tetrahydromethanopterin reductase-like flavin-dependent oxidoreductase (luciferase family)
MLDNMSNGRVIAGFAPGGGQETFNYNTPAAIQREQFWEAVDLIHEAWTREGPFAFEGKHYPLRYVNLWPLPAQKPYPQVWIPGARSRDTMRQVAQRGYCYFLSSRVHGGAVAGARQEFTKVLEDAGSRYDPFRMGILMSAYVAETDEQARQESQEGVWYFLKNCLKGHLRNFQGRSMTSGPGIPNMSVSDYRRILENSTPGGAMLGDADDWEALQKAQSIVVGSPETVYRQIMDFIRETQVGNLLIQFHLGNMRDDLARKSMRLFATEVAPRLREESRVAFAGHYPEMADAV